MKLEVKLNELYPGMGISNIEYISDDSVKFNTKFGECVADKNLLIKGKTKFISKAVDKTEFIKSVFKEIHGDRFDYSNVIYKGSSTLVDIICQAHGVFKQTPSNHRIYSGCPKCGKELEYVNKADTQEEFLKKVYKIHQDKYDYSLSKYKNSITSIDVICPKHGVFKIKPTSLMNGCGCTKCGYESNRLSKDSFIKRASETHKKYYDYSKTIVNFSNDKSIITCRHHGDFLQDVTSHMFGSGCPVCANITSNNKDIETDNIEDSKKVYCEFYILKYTNPEEVFYKIGVTKSLKNRFSSLSNSFKYKIEVLHVEVSNVYDAYKKEHYLKNKLKEFNYRPLHKFSGFTECFNINPFNIANETVS